MISRLPGRADVAGALLCMSLGMAISSLPHLMGWWKSGDPSWVAELDELYYLGVGSKAYRHHPTALSDPIRPEGGVALYRWLPLGPGVLVARALGIAPADINVVWRVMGGAAVGLAWFLLTRQFARQTWSATGLAVLLLTDVGMLEFRPFLRNATLLLDILRGADADLYLWKKPLIHPEWRLASPALTAPFLLAHIWLYARARSNPSRTRIVASAIGFGLLFHVYFYYWVAAGLALLLTLVFDRDRRSVAFHTIWLGGLIGLPVVVADAILKASTSSDWLLRSDKFVPIGRFEELRFPKLLMAVMAISLVWILRRRRELLHPWLLGASGLLLYNHQLLTGLQLENTHWAYVIEPSIAFVALIAAWNLLERRAEWQRITSVSLVSLALLSSVTGLGMRALEVEHTRASRSIGELQRRYQAQRLSPGSTRLEPNQIVVADSVVAELSSIHEDLRPLNNYWVHLSPSVDDREWDERNALEGYLVGLDRSSFESAHREQLESLTWGLLARDRTELEERLAGRVAAYDRIDADPELYLDRYKVRYVFRPAGQPGSAALSAGFEPIQRGPTWDVWERRAVTSAVAQIVRP